MNRYAPIVLAVLALGGCTKTGSFKGHTVDAITGKPVGEVMVTATATGKSDGPCFSFQAKGDKGGVFTIDGLCDKLTYKLSSEDKSMFLQGADVMGGMPAASAAVEVKVWKVPAAEGVFLAAGGEPEQLRQNAVVGSSKILDTQQDVLYPKEFPKGIPKVTSGRYLLVNGPSRNEKLKVLPLVESGERIFGTTKEPEKSEPWSYVGVRFDSDTQFSKVDAKIEPAKVVEFKDGTRWAKFYAADALPTGQYVLMVDGEQRAYLVNFTPGAGKDAAKEAPKEVANEGKSPIQH
jgi:hypothetical protein